MDEILPEAHVFEIGAKLYTLQRNLFDKEWDVCLPMHGWQSTGLPKEYTAAEAETAFRANFKGGAKRFLARRHGGS